MDEDDLSSSYDEANALELAYNMKMLMNPTLQRCFGKNLSVLLLITVRDIKEKHSDAYDYVDLPNTFWINRTRFWRA